MTTHAYTAAFMGIEAREVDVQCQLSSGLPAFNIVGLPDKAVSEAKERVRAALNSIGLALPARRWSRSRGRASKRAWSRVGPQASRVGASSV